MYHEPAQECDRNCPKHHKLDFILPLKVMNLSRSNACIKSAKKELDRKKDEQQVTKAKQIAAKMGP
jgi:hypothetical protein